MTTTGLVGFLIAVTPGLVFARVRERYRPQPERSVFGESVDITAVSVLFSTIAAFIIVLLEQYLHLPFLNAERLLREGRAYIVDNASVSVVTATVQLWLSVGLAALAASRASRSGARLWNHDGWYHLFRVARPENSQPFVRIDLDNGDILWGRWIACTAGAGALEREVVLAGPMKRARDGSSEKLPAHWKSLVVPASRIRVLAVTYMPSATQNKTV